MLNTLFVQTLNMSFTASIIILFVLLARLLLKKTPKIFSYSLWGVVLFRLVCPFSFESLFSLLPTKANPIPSNISDAAIPTGIPAINNAVNAILPQASSYESISDMQIWTFLGRTVWLIGIVALLVYSIMSFLQLRHRLNYASLMESNIYETTAIKTPFVLGILKPKIYLPAGLTGTEKEYILKHEQTHIKRVDYLVKPFSFFVLCIHWFNPLVWLAFLLMSRDMEMSCDERVVKELGEGIKPDYCTSLLTLSDNREPLRGSPLAFGEGNTKSRIKNVLSYKKPAFWIVIVTLLAVIAVSIGLISNPKTDEKISFINYNETYIGAIYDKENQLFSSEEDGVQIPNERHRIAPETTSELEKIMQIDTWKEIKDRIYDIVAPDIEVIAAAEGRYLMYDNVDGKTYFEIFNPNWELERRTRRYFAPKEVYQEVKDYIKSLPLDGDITTADSPYQFSGSLDYFEGYGYFQSEYTPKSAIEEAAFNWFLEEVKTTKSMEFTNYTLHKLSVLTKDELLLSSTDYNQAELMDLATKENLVEPSFVYTEYTSEYSPELFKRGPQFIDQKSSRIFLVGKTEADKNYRVYGFDLPFLLGEDIPPLHATILGIDLKNNILQVAGLDQNTIKQIGDNCNLSCGRGLIVTNEGRPVDSVEHLKVGDTIEFQLFGDVEEGVPTAGVTKAVFPYANGE